MKERFYDNISQMALDAVKELDKIISRSSSAPDFNDGCDSVSIIAKYEEAKKIIAELIFYKHNIVAINLKPIEAENYQDEYLIVLDSDGIWLEPFKKNGEYFFNICNITYILGNCSSRVIPYCEANIVYEVNFKKI
ncbi:MAG: hypothetical protein HDT46_10650 [Ruminococcaceae bacterium]|nr:hypothetical protein [Oscillospiraceae bacterium]MBD5116512.1 hypothetical protein [Oscillospiraceae bacterium]